MGTTDKTYHCWQNMIQRCTNPNNPAYTAYGGRGITVCARWLLFKHFYEDMGAQPTGLTLDRIDNNKGYEKNNCRWVTKQENRQNSSHTKLTADKVRIIKALFRSLKPGVSLPTAAVRFAELFPGVSWHAMYDIGTGRSWRNVA